MLVIGKICRYFPLERGKVGLSFSGAGRPARVKGASEWTLFFIFIELGIHFGGGMREKGS